MICERCGNEMEMGYGIAGGGGVGPYFYCETCGSFKKFPDPEMEDECKQSDTNESKS